MTICCRKYNTLIVLSSCLLYPTMVIINHKLYRDKIHKKLELCFESKCQCDKTSNICFKYQFIPTAAS